MTLVMNTAGIGLAAQSLTDLESMRIAAENRYRQFTRDEPDADGEIRGHSLDETLPEVAKTRAVLDQMADLEKDQVKALQVAVKNHPLGDWVKRTKGVGEKQAGRLIAAVGDPYMATRHTKTDQGITLEVETSPRTLREFLTYCGYGVGPNGGARARKKGEKFSWNPEAKMRVYLIANSIIKAGGPMREVYDEARAKYEGAPHLRECARCGPSGSPAQAGSPLNPGHVHARALRAVSKAVLTDLYNEAKDWHAQRP